MRNNEWIIWSQIKKRSGSYWSSRYTSNAKIVVDSDSQVTISWTNNGGQDYDNISILGSTDGVNYSEVATATPATTSKTLTGLNFVNDYWWKIMYKKDGNYSTKYAVARCWSFTMTCITTGAQTLKLDALDVINSEGIRINWGDSSGNNYTGTGSRTHAYSGAATYTVRVINSLALTKIFLNDAKINNFNSNVFLKCGDNLGYIDLRPVLVTPIINSADMQHLRLNNSLLLYFSQSGTYTINSEHFKNYTLNNQIYLYFSQAGTYTINSEHFKNYTLDNQLYLYFRQLGTYTVNSEHFKNYKLINHLYLLFYRIGTYTINSEHFKNYTLNYTLYLYFSQLGTYTINSEHFKNYNVTNYNITINSPITTVSRSDFSAFTKIATFIFSAGLTTDEVDNILKGFYDALVLKTNVGGTINLSGNGNAPPSGTYQPPVSCLEGPATGKEAAYELLNDSCNRTTNEWATVTVEGGL